MKGQELVQFKRWFPCQSLTWADSLLSNSKRNNGWCDEHLESRLVIDENADPPNGKMSTETPPGNNKGTDSLVNASLNDEWIALIWITSPCLNVQKSKRLEEASH